MKFHAYVCTGDTFFKIGLMTVDEVVHDHLPLPHILSKTLHFVMRHSSLLTRFQEFTYFLELV